MHKYNTMKIVHSVHYWYLEAAVVCLMVVADPKCGAYS